MKNLTFGRAHSFYKILATDLVKNERFEFKTLLITKLPMHPKPQIQCKRDDDHETANIAQTLLKMSFCKFKIVLNMIQMKQNSVNFMPAARTKTNF